MLETVQRGFSAVKDLFVTVKKDVKILTTLSLNGLSIPGEYPLRWG